MITSSNKKKSVIFFIFTNRDNKNDGLWGKLGHNAIQKKSSKTRIKSIFLNKK